MANCSGGKQNPKGLDSTVGRLVWVRRKNGSWWPGQIVDLDQSLLDAGKSSAVPIKLLGRDDVNVDWYNLEESVQLKQVKAFRCGDHTSCIQKAKASQFKSRHKRGPREKAIILALELEAALMSKDDLSCEADNYDTESHQSWSYPSRDNQFSRITSSSMEDSDSTPELCCPETLKRKRTPVYSENDDSKGSKQRMRGLDDLCVGSGMKRLSGLVTKSGPRNPVDHTMNGSGAVCLTYFRKKRSKVVFEEIPKEKDSLDMPKKVLQSDVLVSVPIIYDDLPSPRKSSSITKSCRFPSSDLSGMPDLLGYESSDNLFDVVLIGEEELPNGFLHHMNDPAVVGSWISKAQKKSNIATSAIARVSDVAQETKNVPLAWQSKRKRSLRRRIRNPKLDSKNGSKFDQLHRFGILEPFIRHTNSESVLYDVQIKMEPRNGPQDVPKTSLTSKLNRKPVSGHSIVVEVLGDGESDFLSDSLERTGSDESKNTRKRSFKSIKRGSSKKKTRMVSSIKKKPPGLACIPVKLVFRRINEALNG